MKTITKFFKHAAKWYFKQAVRSYAWMPTGSLPVYNKQ